MVTIEIASNCNEDMGVCVTKMEEDFDTYQGDKTTDESSDEDHSGSNRDSANKYR